MGLIDKIYSDNLFICGDAAGQVDAMAGGGIILGMLGGKSVGIVASKAIEEGNYSENRLKEYETLFNELSFNAVPKLLVIMDFF